MEGKRQQADTVPALQKFPSITVGRHGNTGVDCGVMKALTGYVQGTSRAKGQMMEQREQAMKEVGRAAPGDSREQEKVGALPTAWAAHARVAGNRGFRGRQAALLS